jgi:glutathione S-transferase
MITLYGAFRSRATRPLWLLYELDLPFRHLPVLQAYRLADPLAPEAPLNTASPAFLAVNPLGQVPAYVEDDLVLTESLAISNHIARQHGGDLGPKGPAEQALIDQWTLLAATAVEGPALEIMRTATSDARDTPEGQSVIARSADLLQRPLQRLEAHLAAHPWLVGDRFTVADINLAECLRYAQSHPTLIAGFPALAAWLRACQSRPAFRRMWEARMAEPA